MLVRGKDHFLSLIEAELSWSPQLLIRSPSLSPHTTHACYPPAYSLFRNPNQLPTGMSTLTNSIAADQAQILPADASGWQPELGDEACQQPGRAPTEPQCHLAAVRFLPRPLSDFLRPSSPGPGGRWPSPTTSKQQGSSKWDSRETVVHIETEAGALAVLSDFSLAIRLSQAFIHVFARASLVSTYADDCN